MKKHPIDKLIERLEEPIGLSMVGMGNANAERAEAAAHLRRLNTQGFFCAHCLDGPMTPEAICEHVEKCENNPQVKKIADFREALTPSRDTKEAYSGRGEASLNHWTATKDVMAMILARADGGK